MRVFVESCEHFSAARLDNDSLTKLRLPCCVTSRADARHGGGDRTHVQTIRIWLALRRAHKVSLNKRERNAFMVMVALSFGIGFGGMQVG